MLVDDVRFQLHRLDQVDSTSEELFRRLCAGTASHGDAICAREQTAGRGRLGRRWHSARDEGLYLSVAMLWEDRGAVRPPAWTMAGALAVWSLVRSFGIADAVLKWPNDLMVGPAKLAGVLAEARAQPHRPHCVLGIGLDVRQREFPQELRAERPVTSLALLGRDLWPEQLVQPLLDELGPRLELALANAEALAAEFSEALGLAGKQVAVEGARGRWVGTLAAIHLAEGLLLSTASGSQRVPLEHVHSLAPLGPELS